MMEYGPNFPEPAAILLLRCSASRPSFSTSLPDLVLLICLFAFLLSPHNCFLCQLYVAFRSLLQKICASRKGKTCFPTCFPALINPGFSREHPGSLSLAKFYGFFSPSRAWQGYLLFSHLPFLCGARSVPTSRAVSLGTSHDCPHWKNLTMPNPNSLL